jgi:hypothetical protein
MWRGTQFRVAAAMRVQCAATIFIVVGLVVVVGAANGTLGSIPSESNTGHPIGRN